jgi:uncharacterized protein (TIGR02246 family)
MAGGGRADLKNLVERAVNEINMRIENMRTILSYFVIMMMSFSAMAEHHGAKNAELHAAIQAFDRAYATNDVEKYFNFYADDATAYFGDGRVDIAAYHKMWTELMAAGGGVELNEMSDLQVQVMPSGDTAISTSFIDNRTRAPDGTKSTSRAFETDVWQKTDGQWKIISLHYSDVASAE